jgi:4-hydroxybenzoate polyprenyltransferase
VLVLATAADALVANAVASHLQFFAHVVASDGTANLSGERKAARLQAMFGAHQFEYLGNDWADVPVWEKTREAIMVSPSSRLVRKVSDSKPVRVIVPSRPVLQAVVRALRPHQWAKNLLVFAPLVSSHRFFDSAALTAAALVFVAFSFCASATYVLNDLIDIEADRTHPRKKHRPFAAGHLSISTGVLLAFALAAGGLSLAAYVSGATFGILAGYLILTCLYSMWLKREPVVDVFLLTALYVIRVVAGGVAASIPLTVWFHIFSLFLFVSLAFVKRYTELVTLGATHGRGYTKADMHWISSIGISSGCLATLVLALYVTAGDVAVLYSKPQVLLLLCPLLMFWLTRMWFKAGRGVVHDDPVVETLKDPVAHVCALAGALILLLAL